MKMMKLKKKSDNIDVATGHNYPINAKEQGKTFEKFSPLMNHMRFNQLIKEVRYTIEIEYYPEQENDIERKK